MRHKKTVSDASPDVQVVGVADKSGQIVANNFFFLEIPQRYE
jgi:hypothetical protein